MTMQAPDFEDFSREFEALAADPHYVEYNLRGATAWCILAQLQLAFRHPGNTGPTREKAERFARLLQEQVSVSPALTILAEMGWHEEYDGIGPI